MLLLQIAPEAAPKEVKAPDDAAGDLFLYGKLHENCCLAAILRVGK